jgi:hypothetical protein
VPDERVLVAPRLRCAAGSVGATSATASSKAETVQEKALAAYAKELEVDKLKSQADVLSSAIA